MLSSGIDPPGFPMSVANGSVADCEANVNIRHGLV